MLRDGGKEAFTAFRWLQELEAAWRSDPMNAGRYMWAEQRSTDPPLIYVAYLSFSHQGSNLTELLLLNARSYTKENFLFWDHKKIKQ